MLVHQRVYHILIMVLFRPMFSCLHPFFHLIPRAKSQSYRRIMVGVLPHFNKLHTFTTHYDSAVLWIIIKKTIILPQNIWNNIHHDTIYIYIYIMWELNQCSGDFPFSERCFSAGSTRRAPSSAFSRTALKPGTGGKSPVKKPELPSLWIHGHCLRRYKKASQL